MFKGFVRWIQEFKLFFGEYKYFFKGKKLLGKQYEKGWKNLPSSFFSRSSKNIIPPGGGLHLTLKYIHPC